MTDRTAAVAVAVLGELARSPRMLNHARVLAQSGANVILIGYGEGNLDLPGSVRVCRLHPIRRAAEGSCASHFLGTSALRMGLLFFELWWTLVRIRPACILMQNPPSFPTLLACWLAGHAFRARLVVDWHNYGHSLLALRLGPTHPVVRAAAWYEHRAGRLADAHLCVSAAMRRDLERFGIQARVLRDCPLSLAPAVVPVARDQLRVVCPAGWTADEDISLLVKALSLLRGHQNPCGLELHVTGDGPLREHFQPLLAALRGPGMDIRTGFLPEAEFRDLIRGADLGLSVHRSSSGYDLAIKVVDLFSACVPVCALDYGGSLPEQIEHGVTGFLFQSAEDLAATLTRLLRVSSPLLAMRRHIAQRWSETWEQVWHREAEDIFRPQQRAVGHD